MVNMVNANFTLSEKEVAILNFIAKFGFCFERHIIWLCGTTERYTKKMVGKLVKDGWLEKNKVLSFRPTYLFLTKQAQLFLEVSTTSKLVLNTLNHDTCLIDLYIALSSGKLLFNYATHNIPLDLLEIKTDKELRRIKGIAKSNDIYRIADLLVDDAVAIELELSEKPKTRYETIINSYIINDAVTAVHYYLQAKSLAKKIQQVVKNHPKFFFFIISFDNVGELATVEEYHQEAEQEFIADIYQSLNVPILNTNFKS